MDCTLVASFDITILRLTGTQQPKPNLQGPSTEYHVLCIFKLPCCIEARTHQFVLRLDNVNATSPFRGLISGRRLLA